MATLLVVDDSESIRLLLADALTRHGYRVLTAGDGAAAIRLLAEQPVDLIVTDIFMPETDGLELIVKIKQQTPRPQVIAMSSRDGRSDPLRAARMLGAKATLKKPFPPAELVRHVQTLLGTGSSPVANTAGVSPPVAPRPTH